MIRIMTAEEPASTTITVDGKLSGEGVEAVEASCIQALSRGMAVRIQLHDVSAIDERDQDLPRLLVSQGVGLTANVIYSSSIVGETKPRA